MINYTLTKFPRTGSPCAYGQTNHNDGEEYRATLTHGLWFARGKGPRHGRRRFLQARPVIRARDRNFSADNDHSNVAPPPWNVATSTTFNARSATTEYGNYIVGAVTTTDRSARHWLCWRASDRRAAHRREWRVRSSPNGTGGAMSGTGVRAAPRHAATTLLEQQRLSRHPAQERAHQRRRERRGMISAIASRSSATRASIRRSRSPIVSPTASRRTPMAS